MLHSKSSITLQKSAIGPVTILYNHVSESASADDLDTLTQVELAETALQALEIESRLIPIACVTDIYLLDGPPRVFVNLVEKFAGHDRLAFGAALMTEQHGHGITGSGSSALLLSSNKRVMKSLLRSASVAVPRLLTRNDLTQNKAQNKAQKFIRKPACEHGSIGIDQQSVRFGADFTVADLLDTQWIIEALMPGREFHQPLLETADGWTALPLLEVIFDAPEGMAALTPIFDYAAKWLEESPQFACTDMVLADDITPALRSAMERMSIRAAGAIGARGYVRVDLRLDAEGQPTVLEVNTNPCLSPNAGFIVAARAAGYTPDQVIEALLVRALRDIKSV